LDFNNSKFASTSTHSSAYQTFSYANISALSHLNLKNATFAVENASSLTYTAEQTFVNSILSGLKYLDLSTTKFAVDNTNSNYSISTACDTFASTNLSELTTLNMSNAIFCGANMIDSTINTSKIVTTADATFKNAILSNLNTLDMTNSIFAAVTYAGASPIVSVRTGYQTFEESNLSKLSVLDLSKTVVAVNGMGTTLLTGNRPLVNTFDDNTQLSNLNDIFLPKSDNPQPYN
jgi:hypothetical protein